MFLTKTFNYVKLQYNAIDKTSFFLLQFYQLFRKTVIVLRFSEILKFIHSLVSKIMLYIHTVSYEKNILL